MPRIHNPHTDKTKAIFPNGLPHGFTLEDINPRLERVGLIATTKNPGVSYQIQRIVSIPNQCYSGKCRDPLCRSLHGESTEKIDWWYRQSTKNIKDEIYTNFVRLSRRFRFNGPNVQDIPIPGPMKLDLYLFTREHKIHPPTLIFDADLFQNYPFQTIYPDANGNVYPSTVAQLAMDNYTQGNMSWQHLVDVVPILDVKGEDE